MRTIMCANPSRSITRIVVLLAVLIFTGTSCQWGGQNEPEEASVTVDLNASREKLRADLEEAEEVLAPAQFQLRHGVSDVPSTCELSSGEEGESVLFYVRESRGPVDDPKGKADLIAEHWRKQGYEVEVVTEIDTRVVAKDGQGGFLRLVVGEPGMTLSGETPCVPA